MLCPFPCVEASRGDGLIERRRGATLLASIELSVHFVYIKKEKDEFFEGVLKEPFKFIVTMLALAHTYLLEMNSF